LHCSDKCWVSYLDPAYAHLYDGTVAADYYRAMASIEEQSALGESADEPQFGPGHLLAMVDTLSNGTLNENQRETIQSLRAAILTLIGKELERSMAE
jgi:hypothetical protein